MVGQVDWRIQLFPVVGLELVNFQKKWWNRGGLQLLKINSSTGNQSSNTLFIFQDNVFLEQCEVAATGYFFIVSVILRNLVKFKVERITEIPSSTYLFKLKLTDTIAMSMVKFHYCWLWTGYITCYFVN